MMTRMPIGVRMEYVTRMINHYTYKVINPTYSINVRIREEYREELKQLKSLKLLGVEYVDVP